MATVAGFTEKQAERIGAAVRAYETQRKDLTNPQNWPKGGGSGTSGTLCKIATSAYTDERYSVVEQTVTVGTNDKLTFSDTGDAFTATNLSEAVLGTHALDDGDFVFVFAVSGAYVFSATPVTSEDHYFYDVSCVNAVTGCPTGTWKKLTLAVAASVTESPQL